MSVTVAQIITDIQEIVGETAGSGVQALGEDRMLGDVRRAFNLVVKKWPWPQYRQWFRDELDETIGKVVTTGLLAAVPAFEDIIAVYRDGQVTPMPVLPKTINPYTLTGTSPQYYTSLPFNDADFAGKLLQFWPLGAEGFVNIGASIYPKDNQAWTTDDVMDLDRDLLAYAGAYLTLSNDDLNPGAAQGNLVLMESRLKDIVARMASRPLAISGEEQIPMDWFPTP